MKGVTSFIVVIFAGFFGIQYLLNNVLNFHMLDDVLPFLFVGIICFCAIIGIFSRG